jgi:hypothetical protein
MAIKNKKFLVKGIIDTFARERKEGRKNCGYISQKAGESEVCH